MCACHLQVSSADTQVPPGYFWEALVLLFSAVFALFIFLYRWKAALWRSGFRGCGSGRALRRSLPAPAPPAPRPERGAAGERRSRGCHGNGSNCANTIVSGSVCGG